MARHSIALGFSLCAALLAAGLSASPAAQDVVAQIEDLIRQSNEQMNVKGQFERSAELAQQALDLSLKAGDRIHASTAMVYLSAAYAYQGRLSEAVQVSQRNLPLARETGNKRIIEDALNSLASTLGESGRYEEALAYLYECLDVARSENNATMQYMSLLNIGEAYVRSGDPDQAEGPLRESLRAAGKLKHTGTSSDPSKKGTEMALLNLGAMEIARQHYRPALAYYERVHASRPESPLWVITAIAGMAEAYEQLGDPRRAIDLLGEAIPLAEKASNGLQSARLLTRLGVNQEALGQLDEALASESRALVLMHQSGGNPDYEWQVEGRIGHVQRARGRSDDALDHYRKSIDGIEHLRSVAVNTEEGRAGVLAKSRDVYAETADLLFDMRREGDALATAERGRARAFLDMLAESRVGVADDLSDDQRKRRDAVLARMTATQKALWKEESSADAKKKLEAQLLTEEADMERLQVEIRQTSPRYASVQYPEPACLAQIRSALLDDRTALVEYLLGDKRSLVWVVTRNSFTSSVLPPRKQIEDGVAEYRKLLSEPVTALTLNASLANVNRQGAQLYRSIFQPVQAAIGSSPNLIIVPDGALGYLPFEALVTGSRPLDSGRLELSYVVEKTAIVYGPSASALAAVRVMNQQPAAPAKMLLALGDPVTAAQGAAAGRRKTKDYAERGFSLARLPYTRDEVLAIGRLFPAAQRELLLGTAAREETVKRARLEDYRFIHFATHGFLDEARPGRSGILLSRAAQSTDDGILQMGEIMRLKMNADLVTLSACSTGLGKLVNGEGILGLTRAMFYAGARNVAVSLWNVNDSATAALMESLYRGINQNRSKSEAMREAKLSLLHNARVLWHHPYFWGPFIVEGEGR